MLYHLLFLKKNTSFLFYLNFYILLFLLKDFFILNCIVEVEEDGNRRGCE